MLSGAAAAYSAEQREMDGEPPLHFVTGSLHVDFLKPTPRGTVLELRGGIRELKVVVEPGEPATCCQPCR